MKKIYLTCSLFVAFAMSSMGFSAEVVNPAPEQVMQNVQQGTNVQADRNGNSDYDGRSYGMGYGSCAQPQCPPDVRCNDCYCLMCHYEPCYYTVKKCVYDPCPQYKKCCRMVPKYYTKKCCRMVPQYYEETYCKQEPEYYTTCSTVYKPRTVCERHCKYVPKYYYKHVQGCPQTCAPAACEAQ